MIVPWPPRSRDGLFRNETKHAVFEGVILLKHRRFTLLFVMLIVWTMLPAFASAASKITLRGGTDAPLKIFAGHSYALSVSGRNVKWYTSNKSVATIGVTTGRLCPSAPGTVTITAKDRKTGETVATKNLQGSSARKPHFRRA